MSTEENLAMEILAVAARRTADTSHTTSQSTSTATSDSLTAPSHTPLYFPTLGASYPVGITLDVEWDIDPTTTGGSFDTAKFQELDLFQAGQNSTIYPENYNTSTPFNVTELRAKLYTQDCETGPVSTTPPYCAAGQLPSTFSGQFIFNSQSVTNFTNVTTGASFYFGVEYLVGSAERGPGSSFTLAYFYSTPFTIPGLQISSAGATSTSRTISTSTNAPTATASAIEGAGPALSSPRSGLSTGAKAGIAIGAVGGVLLILIVALLLWRRSKKRQLYSGPGAGYVSQDFAGDRDLHAEKEMNVMSTASSPYEETQTQSGMPNVAAVAHTGQREPTSWTERPAVGSRDLNSESFHDSTATPPPQVPTPPPNEEAYSPTQDRAVPVAAGISRLHEPGMSPEELARLEEEERRLDEAIAEAERRRA